MLIDPKRDEDFGALVTCAIRYAIGRRTYMPKLVVDYVKPLVPELDTKTLWVIRSDIDRQERFDALGDPAIDAPLWRGLYEVVQKELIKRGNA